MSDSSCTVKTTGTNKNKRLNVHAFTSLSLYHRYLIDIEPKRSFKKSCGEKLLKEIFKTAMLGQFSKLHLVLFIQSSSL